MGDQGSAANLGWFWIAIVTPVVLLSFFWLFLPYFNILSLQYWFKFWAIGLNLTGNSRLASFTLACLYHVFKHLSSCFMPFLAVEWLYLVATLIVLLCRIWTQQPALTSGKSSSVKTKRLWAVEGLKVTETTTIQNLNHRLRYDTCSCCQKYWYPRLFFSPIIHNFF